MSSSEGKSTDTTGISQPVQHTTTADGEQSLDSKQIFNLLESLLPLEVCLHYQVLPLELENKRVLLGMVYPEDDAALDYVNRIVSYLNCTIDIQAIAANTHQEILSAYLRYKNTTTDPSPTQQPEIAEATEYPSIFSDTEFELYNTQSELIIESIQTSDNSQVDENPAIATPITPVETDATQLQSNMTILQSASVTKPREKLSQNLPVLSLPLSEELHQGNILPTLPPKQLLTELLARVLTCDIGRLYLERQPYEGKIIWSDNGVLKYALEKLPLSTYQGILNQLKRLVSLSVTTVEEPKQVEKEYLYNNNRLLLRLRIIPGQHGEDATLQVLRGAALKFYHRRRIERLSQDSLRITQHLSHKLHQLHDRLLLNSNSHGERLTALHQLNQLIDKLDSQIKMLTIPSEG